MSANAQGTVRACDFDERSFPASALRARLVLTGPRAVGISTLAVDGDGGFAFGAEYDGPITHTGDQDKMLNLERALLGRTKL